MSDDEHILHGVRIVDMTFGIAGPAAAHLLAEQGAEVIKVEPPAGDPFRSSAGFATLNRSKRGVVVELGDPAGRATLKGLLEGADVLLHSLSGKTATALCLDDESLAQRFPNLIVSSVTGYAVGGPDADRTGYDILVQARSGMMDEVLGARPGPIFLRYALPSWAAAYMCAAGILARLIHRERTGRGGPVHTSLYQASMAVMTLLWNRAEKPTDALTRKIPLPKGEPGLALSMFECQDGRWLHTNVGYVESPPVIETLAEMGHEPIIVETWGDAPTPAEIEVLREAFKRRPLAEWLAAFHACDVPAAAVDPLGSVFRDPQAEAIGAVVDLDDPVWGRVRQTLSPFRTSPPSEIVSPAPSLGQHQGIGWRSSRLQPGGTARNEDLRRPLEGLKVLDFGVYVAGPFATMLLADLGAEVIKVENASGDPTRRLEMQFLGSQRGKRSIAINLRDARTRPVLEELVRWADIVHHNMRLSGAGRLGIDYASLKAVNSDVIFSHVSAYGHTGPKADFPGYDTIASAASGWPAESAPPGTKPLWYRLSMMDLQTAMASVLPTLLAVFRRLRGGEDSDVSTSMLGIAAMSNSETMLLLDSDDIAAVPRLDTDQTGLSAGYRIYRAAGDRWLAVAAVDQATLERFRSVASVDTDADLVSALAAREVDELLAALTAADVPAELVRCDNEVPYFDSWAGTAYVVSFPHPVYGTLEQPSGYWDFVDLELRRDRRPPLLGEHSVGIMRELGIAEPLIAELVADGVVHVEDPRGMSS